VATQVEQLKNKGSYGMYLPFLGCGLISEKLMNTQRELAEKQARLAKTGRDLLEKLILVMEKRYALAASVVAHSSNQILTLDLQKYMSQMRGHYMYSLSHFLPDDLEHDVKSHSVEGEHVRTL